MSIPHGIDSIKLSVEDLEDLGFELRSPTLPTARAEAEISFCGMSEGIDMLSQLDRDVVESSQFHEVGEYASRRIDALTDAIVQDDKPRLPTNIWKAEQAGRISDVCQWMKYNEYVEPTSSGLDAMDFADTRVDDIVDNEDHDPEEDAENDLMQIVFESSLRGLMKDRYEMRYTSWDARRERDEQTDEQADIIHNVQAATRRKRSMKSIITKLRTITNWDDYNAHRIQMMTRYHEDKDWRKTFAILVNKHHMDISKAYKNATFYNQELHYTKAQWQELFDAYVVAKWVIRAQWCKSLQGIIALTEKAKTDEDVTDDIYSALRDALIRICINNQFIKIQK